MITVLFMNDMCLDSIPHKIATCEDLPDQSYLMTEYIKQIQKSFEDALTQVLRQVLGREPVIEDWKDCTRLYKSDGDPMNFWFAWKGITLGKVTFEMGPKYTVTFTPDEKYR